MNSQRCILVFLLCLSAVRTRNHEHRIKRVEKFSNSTNGTLIPLIKPPDVVSVQYNSVYILPECPCTNIPNNLCNYECCYCDLGCEVPRSPVTGELWLKDRFEHCGAKKTFIPFEKKRLDAQLGEAFPLALGFCNMSGLLVNQLNWLFRFLCLRQDNFPSHGSFYPIISPEFTSQNLIASASLEEKRFLWPMFANSFPVPGREAMAPPGNDSNSRNTSRERALNREFEFLHGFTVTADLCTEKNY